MARAECSAVRVLLGALLLDWAFGEPSSCWHPVAGIGRLIAAGRAAARWRSPAALLVQGALIVVVVGGVAVALALLAERVLIALPPALSFGVFVFTSVSSPSGSGTVRPQPRLYFLAESCVEFIRSSVGLVGIPGISPAGIVGSSSI